MKIKTYTITSMDTNQTWLIKAQTPAVAMSILTDRYFPYFYGPMYIDGIFEIYQQDGMKLKFSVS